MQQDIYQSLARLEQTLQSIDGARLQVEKVTKSYEGCATEFRSIADVLHDLAEGMKLFMDSLKNHQEALDGKIFEMVQSRLEAFGASVESLRDMSQQMNTLFRDGCDQGLQTFQSTAQNAVTSFRGSLDHANQQQQQSLDRVSTAFEKTVNRYIDKIERTEKDLLQHEKEMLEEHDRLISETKVANESLGSRLVGALSDIKGALTAAMQSLDGKVAHLAKRQEEDKRQMTDSLDSLKQQIEANRKLGIGGVAAGVAAVILLVIILCLG